MRFDEERNSDEESDGEQSVIIVVNYRNSVLGFIALFPARTSRLITGRIYSGGGNPTT